jgi:hypothetical protein
MDPIRRGDRGPAVEDIQRRLRTLGYDLGRAGIDGIYAGATARAVKAFQLDLGLSESGLVGEHTWSALVDATFTLGDRMLYLRMPHFHGRDVRVLQEALNVLGFACGATDGIFGVFTERAVRELQRNAGLPVDGIVGLETVSCVTSLRHVWEGKEPLAHSAAHLALARAADVLARTTLAVSGLDEPGERVAERVINLAKATSESSLVTLLPADESAPAGTALVLRICAVGTECATAGRPVVSSAADSLAARLLTAVAAAAGGCPEVIVELDEDAAGDERGEQRAAVALIDAVCVVFQ